MILMSLEEFTAKRRGAQDSLEHRLHDVVAEAVRTHNWVPLLVEVERIFEDVYFEESGDRGGIPSDGWLERIEKTLELTKGHDSATIDRIAVWLATAMLTEATVEASKADPEELLMEWVTMHDSDVREAHRHTDGQQRPIGDKFSVDGHEMIGPGDPSAPIELWINCRCTLRPVLASEALVAASLDHQKLTVVVALPVESSAVHEYGAEQKHLTLAFLGEFDGDIAKVQDAVAGVGGSMEPFTAQVSGTATLGPDQAKVWLCEAPALAELRNRLLDNPEIAAAVGEADTHPHFIPHVTIGYEEGDAATPVLSDITFDRLAVWHADQQTEFALGDAMTKPTEVDPETAPESPAEDKNEKVESGLVPWHGVLAPEGIASGDGRKFAEGALRTRTLPLPLTWQKTSASGHDGSVTVARIDRIERVSGEMRATGVMLATPEADEVIGLLADFGRFGVSVDADDASFEMDDEAEEIVFNDARICSASIVAIPAFAEAWVSLGEAPADFFPEEAVPVEEVEPEGMVASGHIFKDLAPGKTEDGPGWLTHPVDTDRLRDYWVRGEGAAKIGWGTPGDFNRCRVNVAEYVKPQYLNGYCANRHYDALGFWPGRPVAGETEKFAGEKMDLKHTQPAEALSLVAGGGLKAPAEWFTNPNLDALTPLNITEEGRVFGHVAGWKTCHSSWADTCVTPPHSATGYAHFLLGEVLTTEGSVPVGSLTIGGGHAGPRLSLRAAQEHYDSTSAVFADVTAGEDEHGIWVAGWVRPGVSDEMVAAARASKLSGDWRRNPLTNSMEMVAALAVNVPGFAIPRIAASVEGSQQVSLVAAGVVVTESKGSEGVDMQTLAAAVAQEIMAAQSRKEKMAALAARVNGAQ